MSEKTQELIVDLRLFNEKADRLVRANLTKLRQHLGMSLSIKFGDGRVTEATYSAPDEETVDAFVLTTRLFLQKNDRISFYRMSMLYSNEAVPPADSASFENVWSQLNDFLDAPTYIKFNDEQLTPRTILDVFLYGGLAHTNREKKHRYDLWMATPFGAPLIHMEFVSAIEEVRDAAAEVKTINERVLAALTGGLA